MRLCSEENDKRYFSFFEKWRRGWDCLAIAMLCGNVAARMFSIVDTIDYCVQTHGPLGCVLIPTLKTPTPQSVRNELGCWRRGGDCLAIATLCGNVAARMFSIVDMIDCCVQTHGPLGCVLIPPSRWRGKVSLQSSYTLDMMLCVKMAERVGFEPTVACATSVFKTDAIDHSATSPW